MPEAFRILWKHRKHLLNHFWVTWGAEYMRELQCTYVTNQEQSPPPRVGQLVLIKEPLPRLIWKLGRIKEVFQGWDGKVRSCIMRVQCGAT